MRAAPKFGKAKAYLPPANTAAPNNVAVVIAPCPALACMRISFIIPHVSIWFKSGTTDNKLLYHEINLQVKLKFFLTPHITGFSITEVILRKAGLSLIISAMDGLTL